ncbi:MAG: hypothetical protein FWH04_02640 [Oscillospiraceae bacterium]|nr:hypothetical protein [Oscillospiraceae bacterium]
MKITALAGHYGSGKTQLAINLALYTKKTQARVVLCDLDIVNPYFRSNDIKNVLNQAGIDLISSDYAGTNIEMPGLAPSAAAIFDSPEGQAFADIGGDERGALVLGRWAEKMQTAEMILVVNMYRPLSGTPKETLHIVREIEAAARVKFTSIINNSNIGLETTGLDVVQSLSYAREVSRLSGLPVRLTSVKRNLVEELSGRVDNLLALDIYDKPNWKIS